MSDKVFKEYLSTSQKDYQFTLKLAVDDVTDRMLDVLEAAFARYEIVTASAFTRTPIQESPLDFPNINNSPVYISQITTIYPASRNFLQTYIANSLRLSEQKVVIYSENDPRKYTTDFHLDVNSAEYKENYVPALGEEGYDGDITNEEASELYGEKYNMNFLQELSDARDSRVIDIVETPLSVAETTGDLPKDYATSFNKADLEDEPMGIFGRPMEKYTGAIK